MNNISDTFISAASIITEAAIKQLKFDKTVSVEIVALKDSSTGEYRVKYNGNEMTAYSSDITLEVGDTVYMKVPEGDFSNKKTLEGKTTGGSSVSSGVAAVLPDQEFAMGDEFNIQELGLSIQRSQQDDGSYVTVTSDSRTINDNNDSFQSYASIYHKFKLKTTFNVTIEDDGASGNYALDVVFGTADGETYTVRLDKSNMNANALGKQESSDLIASGLFEVRSDITLTGIESVTLVAEGGLAAEDGSPEYQIGVDSLSLQFIEVTNLSNVPYYVAIATKSISGNDIEFEGSFYYYGKLQTKNIKYYWYKQDYSVTAASDDYDLLAGYGWKKATTEEGQTITVTKETYDLDYKLVVIYDDDVSTSAIVTVQGTGDPVFELLQEGTQLSVLAQNADETTENYSYNWWVYYNGQYSKLEATSQTIDISAYLIYPNVMFYCQVLNGGAVIDILSTAQVRVADTNVAATFVGIDLYNYDANGEMPIEQAEQYRFLKVQVDWGTDKTPVYWVKWYAPDGKELDSQNYTPEKSMMRDLHVSDGIVWYSIRSTYSDEYNRNTLTAKVFTADEGHMFKKEILFTKTGDPGTNGTAYQAVIRYCDANGNTINDYCGCKYNDTTENNYANLTLNDDITTTVKNLVIKDKNSTTKTIAVKIGDDLSTKIQTDKLILTYDSATTNLTVDWSALVTSETATFNASLYGGIHGNSEISDIGDVPIGVKPTESTKHTWKLADLAKQYQYYHVHVHGYYSNGNGHDITYCTYPICFNSIEDHSDYAIVQNPQQILAQWDSTNFEAPYSVTWNNVAQTQFASSIFAKIEIYKNNALLAGSDLDNWNYFWGGQNLLIPITEDNKATVTTSAALDTVKYISAMAENETLGITLYPKLPIDSYTGINPNNLTITNAPNWVQYSSNGLRPQYVSAPFDVTYDNNAVTYEDINSFIRTNNGETRLNPPLDMDNLLNSSKTGYKMGQYKIKIDDDSVIYRTVLVYKNTYGNEAINGWDGISLSWQQDSNSSTILATQVGAGTKDGANRFTGVVMGKVTDTSLGSGVYGLYGYKNGENTFYINEDGDCYLKGKIEAEKGKIAGWTINANSLTATTEDGKITINADGSIAGSNGKSGTEAKSWSIKSDGTATFNNGTFTGDVTATTLSASHGTIGNWNIGTGYLKGGNTYLQSTGALSGTNWEISETGSAKFQDITSATITDATITRATITDATITRGTITTPVFSLNLDGQGWYILQSSQTEGEEAQVAIHAFTGWYSVLSGNKVLLLPAFE